MSAPFHCLKTNYGRDYCYDIGLPQCEVCKQREAKNEAAAQEERARRAGVRT